MCKECGGSGICEHGRRRSKCKECRGGPVTILEATEVEEFEEEDEAHEWLEANIVIAAKRPRSGKRKR